MTDLSERITANEINKIASKSLKRGFKRLEKRATEVLVKKLKEICRD